MKIVLCAGIPRSASKLVFHVTHNLVRELGYPVETYHVVRPPTKAPETALRTRELYRIASVHPYAAAYMERNRPVAISSYRDPRAVVASLRRAGSGQGIAWELSQLQHRLHHFSLYAKYGALLLKYEEFTTDIVGLVRTISSHLFNKNPSYNITRTVVSGSKLNDVVLADYPGPFRVTGSCWEEDLTQEEVAAIEDISADYMDVYGYERIT